MRYRFEREWSEKDIEKYGTERFQQLYRDQTINGDKIMHAMRSNWHSTALKTEFVPPPNRINGAKDIPGDFPKDFKSVLAMKGSTINSLFKFYDHQPLSGGTCHFYNFYSQDQTNETNHCASCQTSLPPSNKRTSIHTSSPTQMKTPSKLNS